MAKAVPRIEVICPTCGAAIQRLACQLANGRGRYCSRACNAKANLLRKRATRHGLCDTGTYRSWAAMLQRCQNPKATKYPTYGAAGVTVCDAWQTFDGFHRDMGDRPDGTTIDRIDGTGNYEPGNCRWATKAEQQSNLRSNRFLDYRGERLTLSELSRRLGVTNNTLAYRVKVGWPQDRWGEAGRS